MVTKKIKSRGRPRGFDVDAAIEIAQALFHRKGYDGVGVAELSKAIGITAPSLYSAFGSKCQLFERVLQRYVSENGGWLTIALEQDLSLDAMMPQLFIQAAEIYSKNPARPGCLVIDGTRNCTDEEACSISAVFRRTTRQLIYDRIALEDASQAGPLADYVLTILIGLSGAARDGMDADALRATAEIAAAGFSQRLGKGREVHQGSVDKDLDIT